MHCIWKFVPRVAKAALADAKCIHDVVAVTAGKNSDANREHHFRVHCLLASSYGHANICNNCVIHNVNKGVKLPKAHGVECGIGLHVAVSATKVEYSFHLFASE
jgi:hypothetical protein